MNMIDLTVAHWSDDVPAAGDKAPCGFIFPPTPDGKPLPIQPGALKCAVCAELVGVSS